MNREKKIKPEKMPAIICALLILTITGCVLVDPTDPFEPQHSSSYMLPSYGSSDGEIISAEESTVSIPPELTLGVAIGIALTNNPGIAAKAYDVEASDALYDRAWGALLPKVEARAGLTQYRQNRIINPRRPGTIDTIYFADRQLSGDIVLRTPLFAGGRLIKGVRAADLSRHAVLRDLAHTREELVFNVSSIYYSIMAQKSVVQSLKFSQDVLDEHLKKIREMIRAQKAAKVDELRTEVRMADLEQQLVEEKNILAIQRQAFINMLGINIRCDSPPAVTGGFRNTTAFHLNHSASIAKAFVFRNDYRAMRLALKAQAEKVDIARGRHLPDVMLEATTGNRWDARNTTDDNEVGSVGVAVSLPIFEGGMINAEIRRERAKLHAMQERLREKELRIRLEVETAILNINSSLERVRATEKSIEQAIESLRVEREKYSFAKGSITDVLDAQAALLTTQVSYSRALADHSTAIAEYNFAVGKNFNEENEK
ncbi:MAG: TolC family protein [Kiritimatiellia bacterium]